MEDFDPEIWQALVEEISEHVEKLLELLGRIRSMDREGLYECLLHSHSIKSLARTLGEDAVASHAEEMERFLEGLLEGREHLDAERIGWLKNSAYILEGFAINLCGRKSCRGTR